MKSTITTIRLTIAEKRYARALSLRLGCPLTEKGSVAYSLKFLLHERATKEKVPLKEMNKL